MKNLKDVLEKLKIDDIKLTGKFPIDGTLDDIVKFLEGNNFIIIKYTRARSKIFSSAKSKCYTTYNDRIWFADTSKKIISKENPIFYINLEIEYYEVYYFNSHVTPIRIVDGNKEEFLEELNKRFGWE